MSEVISFRLSKDNPREEQALETIRAWSSKGYSVRHILTEALLQLSESNPKQTAATIDELKTTLGQISQLLEQLGNGNPAQKQMLGGQPETSGLTDSFIASVKKSARLGMKLS